ncbi:glycosyl hydrolase family 47-domain-containing protein [Lasiosphaeris hirsuta]|uniref:alpha-1,2-Mannosidase n=1 Tax=Lasiosphaeris hirsuta TaxID=260670 RepID=A0AA40B0S0_9PEZI|nr:glycosyl hydrolase family 47-domain-containing protein [Lasiosphaeris hirsuta]
MLRLRRYRVYVVCAFVVIALLYHVSKNSQWDYSQTARYHGNTGAQQHEPRPAAPGSGQHLNEPVRRPHQSTQTKPSQTRLQKQKPPHTALIPGHRNSSNTHTVKDTSIRIPQLRTSNEVKGGYGLPTAGLAATPAPAKAYPAHGGDTKSTGAPTTTTIAVAIPDRTMTHNEDGQPTLSAEETLTTTTTSTTAHWKKPVEHFPVKEESLIMLPTGTPVPIPAVQHVFGEESFEAKAKRERRLGQVKAEAKRAWDGYKKYAWTHDELVPVARDKKDPFCGWAATLVDAMDTLWLMGMKAEFDDAVDAVKEIDFTTTPYRTDIPVFETIIRYLGGLLGAYDVTGGPEGEYKVLLDKAEELAEILMSVFDTPNRMPILYYHWKPDANIEPKRASTGSGVAEMGTMSMEFTRLAQLTGKNKYYDAVARITDALEELQNREGGTSLPGIFPQNIDASGCNRTAMRILRAENAERKQAEELAMKQAEEAYGDPEVLPPADSAPPPLRNNATEVETAQYGEKDMFGVQTGDSADESVTTTARVAKRGEPPSIPSPSFLAKRQPQNMEPDCIPQGLASSGYGGDSYSMGGSQDSAYEYFPKQYLMLGGLVPKYRAMHEKTVEAVKKYLLFRPMVEGDPDILFSAKVVAPHDNDENLTYDWEVTHLTCFLGGMFGLGGKIFERPEDVEIGRKLSAGCAWAYDVMPTGIMPEFAAVMPCAKADDCHFNKTAWYEALDPRFEAREAEMEEYYLQKKGWKLAVQELKEKAALQQAEDARRKEEEKQKAAEEAKKKQAEDARKRAEEEEEEKRLRPANGTLPEGGGATANAGKESGHDIKEKDNTPEQFVQNVQKRDLLGVGSLPVGEEAEAKMIEDKVKRLEGHVKPGADLPVASPSPDANVTPLSDPDVTSRSPDEGDQKPMIDIILPPEPDRPKTHEEYVAELLERENLVPGFTSIRDPRYILRPEAIESVWYMYRITGDPAWQERGWRMFEAVIAATQTEVGHTAISDVTTSEEPRPTDSMESFWLAETLKYFYLLFTTPDVLSLDEWVLNTEAHPFRRPT